MKTIYACLALACLLAATAAGTASANSVRLSPGGQATFASLGKITFHSSISDTRCAMTLSGRLVSEAVANASGTRIGEIDEFQSSECEGFSELTALELPWPIQLTASYTGTRLDISIVGWSMLYQGSFGGLECLYRGNENASIAVTSGVTGLVTSAANAIRNVGNIFCPSEGNLRGTFSLEPHQTISTI